MGDDEAGAAMSVARNLGRIGKQSAIYGAGSIAATLLGIVLLPLYTSELTPAQFGDAELALRIVLAVAIGLVQLGRLDDMISRRREICTAYRSALPALGIDLVLKDLGFIDDMSREYNVPVELANLVRQTYIRGKAQYGGDAESPMIVKLLEDACGTDLRADGFPAHLES